MSNLPSYDTSRDLAGRRKKPFDSPSAPMRAANYIKLAEHDVP